MILGYKPGDDGMEECYRIVKSEADERSRNKRPHADSEGDSRQSKRKRQSSTSGSLRDWKNCDHIDFLPWLR